MTDATPRPIPAATPQVPIFDRDRALYRHMVGEREVVFQLDDGDDGSPVVEYASADEHTAPHDPALRAELQRLVDANKIPVEVFVLGDQDFADYVATHYAELRAEGGC